MSDSALQEAIQNGDREAVQQLLAASPEIAAGRNEQGISWILLAMYMQQADIAADLGAAKGTLDVYEAVALDDGDRLGELLDADSALLEAEAPDGFRVLHYAAFFGREEIASALIGRGAQVSVPAANPMQVHPLHSAAAARSTSICRALLEAGADANAQQHGGFTALMSAAMHGDLELVRLLLEHGADRALESEDGRAAKDFAVEGGHAEVVAVLE